MLVNLAKTPYPWPGGKSRAASVVWAELGDVDHYVEPFYGGGAVHLLRPHLANRAYYSETINDLDGFVANFWRAVRYDAQTVAEYASWPVIESEVHARHVAIIKWIQDGNADRLAGDVDYYDARIAGWWVYGICAWIGSGWGNADDGPWWPDETGKLTKRKRASGEPGVSRKRPHLSDDGRGVHHAGLREPGVSRKLPHLSDDGRGVHRPQAREPGVAGMPAMPESDWRERVEADYAATGGFHPITMPEIRRWMDWLQARMRHVRVVNGDWRRVCTPGALKTLRVRQDNGVAGIFLDPPYKHSERDDRMYREDHDVAPEVRAWCLKHGNDPDYRIVLAGFAGEGHEELAAHGWRVIEWYEDGFLTGGYGNQSDNGHQQQRERLWASPHCLGSSAALPMDALWMTEDDVDD